MIKLWNVSTWTCEVTVHNSVLTEGVTHAPDAEEEAPEGDEAGQRVGVLTLEMDGDKLVSGGDDSIVRVWNTTDWSCICLPSAHQGEIWSLLFLSDGALVTSSVNGSIRLWREKEAVNGDGNSGNTSSTWECESQADAGGSIYALTTLDGRVVSAG